MFNHVISCPHSPITNSWKSNHQIQSPKPILQITFPWPRLQFYLTSPFLVHSPIHWKNKLKTLGASATARTYDRALEWTKPCSHLKSETFEPKHLAWYLAQHLFSANELMTLTRVHKGEFGSGSSPSQRIDPAHTCHFHPDFVADSVHVFHPRHIHTLTVTHKCTNGLCQ